MENESDLLNILCISGTVGDWKNHFTVAENEQFDKLLKGEFCDSDLKFTYSL
ncbi:MAG: sulfotransferase domain-containing protein [Candidatus Thiodiazotropha sp.]